MLLHTEPSLVLSVAQTDMFVTVVVLRLLTGEEELF